MKIKPPQLPPKVVQATHHCAHCTYLGFAYLEGHGMYSAAALALLVTYVILMFMHETIE